VSSRSIHFPRPFDVGGQRVEPSTLRVIRGDTTARLEARAMEVLVYLAEHAGQVVSREELENQVWEGRIVTEDAVTNAIAKLRRALNDDARHPRYIETVPKVGYRLISQIASIDETASEKVVNDRRPVRSKDRIRGRVSAAAALLSLLLVALVLQPWWGRKDFGSPPQASSPHIRSVAVLPFESLGSSPGYFTNGLRADLITDLSRVSGLRVISPSSVTADERSGADRNELLRQLGAEYVLDGTVQHVGNRLRVNVQLVATGTDRVLWGERYDTTVHDVFVLQDELTENVLSALRLRLGSADRVAVAKRPTQSVVAYEHYLRGLQLHGRRTKPDNEAAKQQFTRAIDIDPSFARAYAGLALAHSRDAIDGWTLEPIRSLEFARRFAEKAAGIDPNIPQVHFVLGQVELFRRQHVKAIDAAQRAVELDPNYADGHALSAWILTYAGRSADAMTAMKKALHLNPRPSASYLEVLGEIQFVQGKYDSSTATFRQVLKINPNYVRARMWIAAALAQAGQIESAKWEAGELQVLDPDFALDKLGFAFPFKDPRVLARLLDGLVRAGLT